MYRPTTNWRDIPLVAKYELIKQISKVRAIGVHCAWGEGPILGDGENNSLGGRGCAGAVRGTPHELVFGSAPLDLCYWMWSFTEGAVRSANV